MYMYTYINIYIYIYIYMLYVYILPITYTNGKHNSLGCARSCLSATSHAASHTVPGDM